MPKFVKVCPLSGCIYCGSDGPWNTAHIVSDSLFPSSETILPEGIQCSRCNSYLGNAVEQYALKAFPFSTLKFFSAHKNKKGRPPFVELRNGPHSLNVTRDPFVDGIQLVDLNTRLVVAPQSVFAPMVWQTTPDSAVCVVRMLLKMAVESLALCKPEHLRDQRFDAARAAIRDPGMSNGIWSYAVVFSNHQFMKSIRRKPIENAQKLSIQHFSAPDEYLAHIEWSGVQCFVSMLPDVSLTRILPSCADESRYRSAQLLVRVWDVNVSTRCVRVRPAELKQPFFLQYH